MKTLYYCSECDTPHDSEGGAEDCCKTECSKCGALESEIEALKDAICGLAVLTEQFIGTAARDEIIYSVRPELRGA